MRIITCQTPLWFGVSEIIIQLIFALVALLIAYYAYKVYIVSRQRPSFLFGLAFLGMSFAYFIQALFNYLLLSGVQTVHIFPKVATAGATAFQLSIWVVALHMFFMVVGLALLSYVTLKERGVKIFSLLLSISLVGLVFSEYFSLTFFIITSIFLAFITLQYYQRHARRPTTNSLLIFLGFGMFFLGNFQLAFASTLSLLYISGHIIALLGYIFLLISLLRVVRR